jgi:hypothetical protein
MNHDETNSQSQPDLQAWIDPEVEARVIAWVMGEASPFEIAQLEKLVAEKPELAIFKRRMETVHGLLGEAARPDAAALQLAPERRVKLLQAMEVSGAANGSARPVAVMKPSSPGASGRPWRVYLRVGGAAAAACVLGVFVLQREGGPGRPAPAASLIGESSAVTGEPTLRKLRAGEEESAGSRVEGGEAAGRDVQMILLSPPLESPTPMANAAPTVELNEAARSQEQTAVQRFRSSTPVVEFFPSTGAGGGAGTPISSAEAGSVRESPDNFGAGNGGPPTLASELRLQQAKQTGNAGSVQGGSNLVFPNLTFSGGSLGADASTPGPDLKFAGAVTLPGRAETPIAEASRQNPRTDEVVMLPSFQVREDADRGYAAVSSLSGTRLMAGGATPVAGPNLAMDKAAAPSAPPQGARASFGGGGSLPRQNANGPVESEGLRATEAKKDDGVIVLSAFEVSTEPKGARRGFALFGPTNTARDAERADKPIVRPASPPPPPLEETSAAKEPFSTFSLHVSDVSFRLAQAALARGELPDPSRIRVEEFYNAFDYGDPAPAAGEKIVARIEQAAHPFLQQRNLVRIAMKVPAVGRGAGQPLRLTVLLDTSGSMEREDRAATVRRALGALTGLLAPNDRITLISFARQPRLLAEAVAGDQAGSLVRLAARTPAEGGTNLEEALKLGGELARRHHLAGAQNRIVVLTDGAANLGDADPERLSRAVVALRQQGIAFDACGVGLDGLDDAVLEALTRKGDGRYMVLNSPEAADANFAAKLAGAFRPAAENVKLQVRFNPARVANYRLIGFERHRLAAEDFRNDAVDAAELASEEAAVALYQVEVLPEGTGELGEVFVRFRDPASGGTVERSWTLAHEPGARAFDRATPTLQLAGTAALLAEKLRGGPGAEPVRLREIAGVMDAVRLRYANDPRIQDLATMFAQARRLTRD